MGLKCLHDNNISHMDLKMDNIMKFDNNRYKIIDLGSSIDLTKHISNRYKVRSTLDIMPPEMHNFKFNRSNINKSYDIWSYGVILYQLITGTCFMKCSSIKEAQESQK